MPFTDRADAGRGLAEKLGNYLSHKWDCLVAFEIYLEKITDMGGLGLGG